MEIKVKKIIKRYLKSKGIEIKRYHKDLACRDFISLNPGRNAKGNVLLSYIIEPWVEKKNILEYTSHTHFWESVQIAQTFLEMGYAVDAIDYRNQVFIPNKKYNLFVGARTNFERLSRLIDKKCKKIVHLDTSHWSFNNHAAHTRLYSLVERKGVCPKNSIRIIEQNSAIENADMATILGNESTQQTYAFAGKSMYRVPISSCAEYPWDDSKDFKACSKNFLWFGSAGAIHRGLDILLDVFVHLPAYNLYICGPIEKELEFVSCYRKELYNLPNIHMLGWMDVNSRNFSQLLKKCLFTIFPSCAEGGSGSVVNCMHAGLIPVVTKEAGVDIGNFGRLLPNVSHSEMNKVIEDVASLPQKCLREMSRTCWEFARTRHTRKNFAAEYRRTMEAVVRT